jgi:signal transduction histidine kinase
LDSATPENEAGGIDAILVPVLRLRGPEVIAVNAEFRNFVSLPKSWAGPGVSATDWFLEFDGTPWRPWDNVALVAKGNRGEAWRQLWLTLDGKDSRAVVARYFLDINAPQDAGAGVVSSVYLLPADQMPETANGTEETNEELNLALAHISHEFRTPLNAILGFSEIMAMELMGKLAPTYRDYALDIQYSAEHLKRIVEQMLDIAKLARGKMALDEGFVSLAEVVHRSFGLLQAAASARGVDVQIISQTDFPSVYGDEGRLRQVFLNILGNAVKFSQEGGHVQTDHVEQEGVLTIWVRDQGDGMTDGEIERATMPFSRARAAVRSNKEGTGLGLPISRWILEAHMGTLKIESAKGKGTSVGLELPASRVVFAENGAPVEGTGRAARLRLSDLAGPVERDE